MKSTLIKERVSRSTCFFLISHQIFKLPAIQKWPSAASSWLAVNHLHFFIINTPYKIDYYAPLDALFYEDSKNHNFKEK